MILCPLRQGAVPVESCAGRDRHGRPQQAPPLTARGHLVLPAACCGRGIVSGTNRAARRLAVVSPGVAGLAVPVSQNGQQSGNEQHSNSSRCRPSPQHLPQLNRSKQLPQTASGPGSDPQLPYRADNAQNRPIGAPIAATRCRRLSQRVIGDPCALSAREDAGLEIVTIVRRRRRARVGMRVTA